MLISELKNKIVTGDLDNFYIFTGPEEGIMQLYIKQIAKKLGLTIKWVDSVQEVCKLVNLKSLVKTRYLYLIRLDNGFKSQENLWEKAKQFVGNFVILIQPEIDKRSKKFVDFFEDRIIKFEKLAPEMLQAYGKKVCSSLSVAYIDDLIEWCGHSYSRLMSELDKVKTLSIALDITQDEAFDLLVSENGIYKEKQFDVFEYTNQILSRNAHKCYSDFEFVKAQQQEILIVGLLGASFKNLVLLKNDGGGKGVCDRTGLTSWQIKCAIDFDKYFNIDECERNLLLLQDTEVKIKTGVLTPDIALNYILAEIL